MVFSGINYLAVLAAGVAAFVIGAGWYMALGRQWLAAQGKPADAMCGDDKKMPLRQMCISFICNLFMAFMLAGVIGHLGPDHMNLTGGLISGFFVWAGFVLTTMLVNHTWQEARGALTLIDGGHWLVILLAQGAIIGLMGV